MYSIHNDSVQQYKCPEFVFNVHSHGINCPRCLPGCCCPTQPFPLRIGWLTKTQQATEPKRASASLPSTPGYRGIPKLNKGIKQLEIQAHINFSFNEHLLYSGLISRVTSYHLCVKKHEKTHFMGAVLGQACSYKIYTLIMTAQFFWMSVNHVV